MFWVVVTSVIKTLMYYLVFLDLLSKKVHVIHKTWQYPPKMAKYILCSPADVKIFATLRHSPCFSVSICTSIDSEPSQIPLQKFYSPPRLYSYFIPGAHLQIVKKWRNPISCGNLTDQLNVWQKRLERFIRGWMTWVTTYGHKLGFPKGRKKLPLLLCESSSAQLAYSTLYNCNTFKSSARNLKPSPLVKVSGCNLFCIALNFEQAK